MATLPRPLLSPETVSQAQVLGAAIRDGEVAALVGAGLSVAAGLPNWQDLVTRLILSWRAFDPSSSARRLSPENYLAFVRGIFNGNDLAFVSYLRRILPTLSPPKDFALVLFRALYSDPGHISQFLYPSPNDIHRHLVALFAAHPAHLWTTNYDDLVERASVDLGHQSHSLDLDVHRIRRGVLVTHLHGFLPPIQPGVQLTQHHFDHSVVLAEDDYHAVASNRDQTAWVTNEFNRLFAEHRVLILGMSLVDSNLRRVLATIVPKNPSLLPHYAVMTPPNTQNIPLRRIRVTTRNQLVVEASGLRASYWKEYGLGIVELGGFDQLLPFVMRLRYESFGHNPGALWAEASARGWQKVRPWDQSTQVSAQQLLGDVVASLTQQFSIPASEIVDLGMFLVPPGYDRIELVFRRGQSPPPQPGGRTFSISPDGPEGVAGCSFATGVALRMGVNHVLYNYNVRSASGSPANYKGILVAPLVDWPGGGVPLGVIYLTSATTSGTLFAIDDRVLSTWLQQAGLAVIEKL